MSDEQTPTIEMRLAILQIHRDAFATALTEERRARAEAEQALKAIGDIVSLDNPVSDEMKAVPLVQDVMALGTAHITERKRRQEAEQENARLRALLARYEWVSQECLPTRCVSCGGHDPSDIPDEGNVGHRPDCELRAALSGGDQPQPPAVSDINDIARELIEWHREGHQ